MDYLSQSTLAMISRGLKGFIVLVPGLRRRRPDLAVLGQVRQDGRGRAEVVVIDANL